MSEPSLPSRSVSRSSGDTRHRERRLIERLSGWRLKAFFISAAVNIGLLISLIALPWILKPTLLNIALAFTAATHGVFLIVVAGFRFSIAIKFALGALHATVCIAALVSLDSSTGYQLAGANISTLLMIPIQMMVITIGGVLIAQQTGYHRERSFSVTDLLVVVSTFAILFPVLLRILPAISWTSVPPTKILAAGWIAVLNGWWSLVVVNLYLKILPGSRVAGVPRMIAIGTFLFSAIVDWSSGQFGLLVALWVCISLLPAYGLRVENEK